MKREVRHRARFPVAAIRVISILVRKNLQRAIHSIFSSRTAFDYREVCGGAAWINHRAPRLQSKSRSQTLLHDIRILDTIFGRESDSLSVYLSKLGVAERDSKF